MRITSGNRKGQTAIMFTLAVAPLFGVLGLVVDVGWAHFRKQAAQSAADAAAGAAAMAAYSAAGGGPSCSTPHVQCYATEHTCSATPTSPPSDNIEAGCLYAQANGFVSSGRQTVTFQSGVGSAPTASGVTISYWVIARVSENIPQLFSAVLGSPMATVSARATTGTREASAGGCVITLNKTQDNALSIGGTASLQSGCGVFVNSNSGLALNTNGGGSITTTLPAKTQIVGNCPNNGCNISPAPQTGVPQVTDPFADMNPPSEGNCQTLPSMGSQDTLTINPGTYCDSGFNLSSHQTLKLNPGIYVLDTSTAMAIDLSGQSTLTGDGVTIYLKNGGVRMTGGTTMTLRAPTSGTWQGILFYQDRLNTTAATLEGGGGQVLNGVLYFPSANLTYTGGSTTVNTQTTIVSDTLTMVGNSYMTAAATTQFTGVSGGAFLIE